MSNTQASPEGWTTKSHSHQIADAGDYDGCYEITNGKLSLFTKDDGDDVEEALSGICKAINDTEINFYVDNSDKFVLFATEQENKRLWALMVKHGVNPYEGTDLEKHWLPTPPQEGEAKAIAERFKMPEDDQLIKTAIIFNDGKLDAEQLSGMVGMCQFVIDRLYENGDMGMPSSKE